MQFFSSDKRLQEFFFQKHPPRPSRVKWSAPKQGLEGVLRDPGLSRNGVRDSGIQNKSGRDS